MAGVMAPLAGRPESPRHRSERALGSPPETRSLSTDVLVVGAGPSGIPAAVAAARGGAKVILADQDFVPGGAPVNMYVSAICGGPQVGIFREVLQRLNNQFDLNGVVRTPRSDSWSKEVFLPTAIWWYLPSSFIAVYRAMIAAERNICFIPGLRATGVLLEAGAGNRTWVRGVRFENAGSQSTVIEAPVTVDATGTGLVAELAGCECRYGRDTREEFNEPWGTSVADHKVQRVTWMYISQRVKPGATLDVKRLKNNRLVENAIDGWVGTGTPDYYERNTGIYLHWGATVECRDTRDPAEIGDAQSRAFDLMRPDLEYLASAGFAVHLAPKLGIREVRRVVGEYVLTLRDLYAGSVTDDTVAFSSYEIDAWGEEVPVEYKKQPVKTYGIPYRCLLPRRTEGLLIAGKAISATHLAMSSLRVQPIVASIGTAAGVAAAGAALRKTALRDVPIEAVRRELVKIGTLYQSSQ
ncbi:MAG: putative FAD-binding dehydrogenase [Acidobacteria bacterium]|nr:putative FAD-binding dehydrogenase [Acidobacteriota bacterium]